MTTMRTTTQPSSSQDEESRKYNSNRQPDNRDIWEAVDRLTNIVEKQHAVLRAALGYQRRQTELLANNGSVTTDVQTDGLLDDALSKLRSTVSGTLDVNGCLTNSKFSKDGALLQNITYPGMEGSLVDTHAKMKQSEAKVQSLQTELKGIKEWFASVGMRVKDTHEDPDLAAMKAWRDKDAVCKGKLAEETKLWTHLKADVDKIVAAINKDAKEIAAAARAAAKGAK